MITSEPGEDGLRSREIKRVFDDLFGGVLPGLGRALERKDKPQLALLHFREMAERHPDDAVAWYNLGDTLLALGRHDEAREALEKAIRLDPEVPLFHYDLGLTYYRQEKWDQAASCFHRVAKADPQLRRAQANLGLSALTNLALCQGELGFWVQARETLKPGLRPASDLFYNLGRFALRDGDGRDAERWFTLADQLSPGSEDILHGLASAMMRRKNWKSAESCLARAVKADPSCRDAWYDRGVCLAKEGKPARRSAARRCFTTALRLDPKHAWSEYDLACLDALEGKTSRALRRLTRALDLGLSDPSRAFEDPDLKSLRRDRRWGPLAGRMKPVKRLPPDSRGSRDGGAP